MRKVSRSGSTPGQQYYYYPISPPRGPYCYCAGCRTPAQTATWPHFWDTRSVPYCGNSFTQFSPRYMSDGQYATVIVSLSRSGRQRSPPGHVNPRRDRRVLFHSVVHEPYGDLTMLKTTGLDSDHHYYIQTSAGARPSYDPTRYTPRSGYHRYPAPDRQPMVTPRRAHRPSHATGIRNPDVPRPRAPKANATTEKKPPQSRKATSADAEKHRIPNGISLENWDSSEIPFVVLGSAFDCNSLGKRIYDWTVRRFGREHPISELAGDLWIQFIDLFGRLKKAEEVLSSIRDTENKDTIDDFIESGERLTDKLRELLKSCEELMPSSPKEGKDIDAGVEFINTLWGRDRKLRKTEQLMASIRLWNKRFDANCQEILEKPTL
ncbi:hypothetical protein GE09DRAFT_1170473 [Coniochaeta sp. 2T2.1]|nr:hypothetical protein GE09DRAFT_1170473 [Coniochaeta sp. 2T2.1]